MDLVTLPFVAVGANAPAIALFMLVTFGAYAWIKRDSRRG